jgi:hypothetical protein
VTFGKFNGEREYKKKKMATQEEPMTALQTAWKIQKFFFE